MWWWGCRWSCWRCCSRAAEPATNARPGRRSGIEWARRRRPARRRRRRPPPPRPPAPRRSTSSHRSRPPPGRSTGSSTPPPPRSTGPGHRGRSVIASVGDAVTAADLAPVERALPAGMPAPLLQPAVLVFSDLVSRPRRHERLRAGLQRAPRAPSRRPTRTPRRSATGWRASVTERARRRTSTPISPHWNAAARATPPFTPAAADSRAAAETALLESLVLKANEGCDARGGSRITSLPAIVWQPTVDPRRSEGRRARSGGTPFSATWIERNLVGATSPRAESPRRARAGRSSCLQRAPRTDNMVGPMTTELRGRASQSSLLLT